MSTDKPAAGSGVLSSQTSSDVYMHIPHQPPRVFPPIFKIPPEILWRILELTVLMVHWERDYEYPALETLRDLSRVCSLWRNVLLRSPSIWAQALDLRHLKLLDPEWQEEIVRRTGEAPMDILALQGLAIGGPFASKFVDKHWHRIRSLDFVDEGSLDRINNRLWSDIAQRPSNQLLHLDLFGSQERIFDFFTSIAFGRFPHLQSLKVRENVAIPNADVIKKFAFASAYLPKLRSIDLTLISTSIAEGGIQFLDSINPAEDCILRLSGIISFRATKMSTINKISSIFRRYSKFAQTAAQGHFQSPPEPDRHSVVVFLEGFIDIYIPIVAKSSGRTPSLSFSLRDADSPISQHESHFHQHVIPAMISSLLNHPSFFLGTDLELNLGLPDFFSSTVNSAIDGLLSTFTSVEDLRVNSGAISYLAALQPRLASSETLVLPSLRTIRTLPPPDLPVVKRYLESRKALGASLESLTLVFFFLNNCEEMADLGVLDGLTGLNVRMGRMMPDMNWEQLSVVIQ
ncbi:hypothetical protein CVT26_000272 [Gymnopilus dilepis]|uniref:Uncharacterized protein n=1 Tax=Gymnopilus dilepis TaxID=231916 RepID=A0A409X664_9AGAR|nr:hypothetical protein CVT26_000272 [Gymnopilus dilepis]